MRRTQCDAAVNGDGMIETFRSIVKAWECDTVDHYTTGYYFQAYSSANTHLLASAGITGDAAASFRPVYGSSRFLQELRAGDAYHIESGFTAVDGVSLSLGHKLYNSETGALCSHHMQTFEGAARPTNEIATVDWDVAEPAKPVDLDALKNWTPTARMVVRREHLDITGRFDLSPLIHHGSDANVQFQNAVGMTSSYMQEHRIGFATFEYRMEFGTLPQRAGTVVAARSALVHLGRTSLFFAHNITDGLTGELIANILQYGVHLDRKARRPSEIPAAIRERAKAFGPAA